MLNIAISLATPKSSQQVVIQWLMKPTRLCCSSVAFLVHHLHPPPPPHHLPLSDNHKDGQAARVESNFRHRLIAFEKIALKELTINWYQQ